MSDDWQNRGGVVTASVQLPPMDMNVEHSFELIEVKLKPQVNTPYGIKDKIQFVWKETGKDKDAHRIWTEFNESYSEKSGLVQFIKQASPKPVIAGVPIKLGELMCIGMQIKGLVQADIDNKTKLPSGFYNFIPASIKPANTPQVNSVGSSGKTLADVLALAKGSKNASDVFAILVGKVDNNLIQEFVAADKSGKIKYPI